MARRIRRSISSDGSSAPCAPGRSGYEPLPQHQRDDRASATLWSRCTPHQRGPGSPAAGTNGNFHRPLIAIRLRSWILRHGSLRALRVQGDVQRIARWERSLARGVLCLSVVDKVWIVYREDDGEAILGVFADQKAATDYAESLDGSEYQDIRIWIGGYSVPFRITDGFD